MNNYIFVSDKETYSTINETFKKVFLSKSPQPRRGSFKPLSSFKGTEIDGCKIWFPKFKKTAKGNFVPDDDGVLNQLSEDKTEIIEYLAKKTSRETERRITFAKIDKKYKFIGIFETKIDNDGRTLRHKRISDKCLKP